jgi:hypothetical protein
MPTASGITPTLRTALGTKFDNVNSGTEYLEATLNAFWGYYHGTSSVFFSIF